MESRVVDVSYRNIAKAERSHRETLIAKIRVTWGLSATKLF
jgi:hypothetical protein